MAQKLNENIRTETVNMYLEGKTVSEIADYLNIGQTTIYRILKERKITLDKTRKQHVINTKAKKISTDIKNEIVKSYLNGEYVKSISKRLGLTTYIVSSILKEHNIEIKRFIRKSQFSKEDVDKMYGIYSNGKTLDYVASIYNIDPTEVSLLFKKYNYPVRDYSHAYRKYTINENYFDKIDTQGKAYFLGLLFADGSNNTKTNQITISLQESDKHILEAFKTELGSNAPLKFIECSKKKDTYSNQYRFSVGNKHLSETLERLGMVVNKSLKLEFPNYLEDNLISHFIRGYFDGDGHVSGKYYITNIVSTDSFCKSIQDILRPLNIESKIYNTVNPETSTRTLRINKKIYCAKFLDYIYQDAKFYLIRKYNVYLNRYKNILSTAPNACISA